MLNSQDSYFETTTGSNQFLNDLSIRLVKPTQQAQLRAGEQCQWYPCHRQDGLQCSACGTTRTIHCERLGLALILPPCIFVPLGRLTRQLVGPSGNVPSTSGAQGRSSKHARLRNGKQACECARCHDDRPERPCRPMARPAALSADRDRDAPTEGAYWEWNRYDWIPADFMEQSRLFDQPSVSEPASSQPG